MPDDQAQAVLAPLQIDNAAKADAWEAFNTSKNETDLQVKLMGMKGLPDTAKADLWEAKKRMAVPMSPEEQTISQLPNAAMQAKASVTRPLTANLPQTVTPQPGESFDQTMNRGVQAGQQILADPNKMRMAKVQGEGEGIARAPLVLGAASIPGALAAPGATLGGILGGAGASYAGRKGAEAAGASPVTVENVSGAAGLIGGIGGGVGGAKLQGMIPNAAKAALRMNTIIGGAKDMEVPTFDASSAALRAKEIGAAGNKATPPVIRKFLLRVMDPEKPRITLEEARDTYTAVSKLTAKDWSEMDKPMQKQVIQFTQALGKNIEDALNTARPGDGTALRGAMDEYHQAMQIKSAGSKVINVAGKAAIKTAGVGLGYEVLKQLGIIGKRSF